MHEVCKPACRVSTSYLAGGLQAIGKGVFPEAGKWISYIELTFFSGRSIRNDTVDPAHLPFEVGYSREVIFYTLLSINEAEMKDAMGRYIHEKYYAKVSTPVCGIHLKRHSSRCYRGRTERATFHPTLYCM
ncbi:hypothetical protein BHU16_05495 [Tannerella sp. oral taxon 808]|nr:hypothetical protein BHU16_05495 [Tannerella sp. oral taxon 808]